MSTLIVGSRIQARVAILTPNSRGAISVIGLWGPDAMGVADAAFRPFSGLRLSQTRAGRPRLGHIGNGLGDEVVAVVSKCEHGAGRNLPSSTVEFQCHGGSAACELVVGALLAAGAIRSDPTDWPRVPSPSPACAAAWADMGHASTARSAEILLEQAQGAFDREIDALLKALDDSSKGDADWSAIALDVLIRRAEVGIRLLRGWRIVLAGRPNVGKSSLLNALAGYPRSIVDASPGTTRDVVALSLSIDGWPVELSDTAGLRVSAEGLERMGIERARQAYSEADFVLPVLDRSQKLMATDHELVRKYSSPKGLIVANKSDLAAAWHVYDLGGDPSRIIEVSTRDRSGIGELVSAIGRRMVSEVIPPGSGVPFRIGQLEALREARERLATGDREGASARLIRLMTLYE